MRERVGIFDVSHLGKARVSGPGAADFVNDCLTNDLRRIGPGQAQYTMCCTETGGVVDDLIQYLRSDDDVFLIPNAANTATVVEPAAAAAPEGITVENLHDRYGVIAVQGPRSDEALRGLGLPVDHDYMSFVETDWRGCRSSSAAPATRASGATRSCRRGTSPARCGTPSRRRSPRRTGCPPGSAPATRCAPRWATRCTATTCHRDHPGDGRRGLGCRLGQAALLGPGCAHGAARGQGVPPDARARGERPRHPAVALRRQGRERCGRRRGHLGHLLAHPQAGHRARPARPLGDPRRRGRRRRARPGRPATVSKPPFVEVGVREK